MKKLIFITVTLLIIFFFNQCKKSETTPTPKQTAISYALTGKWGLNLLSLNDSTTLNSIDEYSFSATLQSDAALKIIITNLSTDTKSVWFYEEGSNEGWSITDYDNNSNQQIFTSLKSGTLDLQTVFSGSAGSCRLDYYENNSTTPVKSRHLAW
jgi:hypothetical protein